MKIIEFLTLWIKEITIVFIVISIIEIMLPNTNMKKYIDMIIGFLIIIVIMSPFVKLLNKDLKFNEDIKNNFEAIIDFENNEKEDFKFIQEEQIENTYIKKIEKEIKGLICEKTEYNVEKIKVDIYRDEIQYGEINSIEITLTNHVQNQEIESEDLILIKNIDKISIGEGDKDDAIEKDLEGLKESEYNDEVKEVIFKNYNIPMENIKIFFNTSEEES